MPERRFSGIMLVAQLFYFRIFFAFLKTRTGSFTEQSGIRTIV